jgi:hypothetical protein
MKWSLFSEEQIFGILRVQEAGRRTRESGGFLTCYRRRSGALQKQVLVHLSAICRSRARLLSPKTF